MNEKQAFAERLKLALRRSVKPVETPAELALKFNLQHHESITPQAAQKWLSGQAKPTVDKIETLAKWLRVSPHWLNYGDPDPKPADEKHPNENLVVSAKELSAEEAALIGRFRTLTATRRTLIQDLVVEFALEQEVWPKSDLDNPALKP